MWHAMIVAKDSVTEKEGGWWDGNRHESHAERGSLAEKLQSGLPSKSGFCLICGSLFPYYLSSSTFSFYSNVRYPFPLFCLLPRSLSSSVLILSILAQLKMQLLTAHHLGLDHQPTHCIEGLLGLIPLQMILFLFETKRTNPYLYYSSCRDWREGRKKKITFLQETCVWWRVYWAHIRLKSETAVTV